MTRYLIIEERIEHLAEVVEAYLSRGWKPLGGPSFVVLGNPEHSTYVKGFQAITKDEK